MGWGMWPSLQQSRFTAARATTPHRGCFAPAEAGATFQPARIRRGVDNTCSISPFSFTLQYSRMRTGSRSLSEARSRYTTLVSCASPRTRSEPAMRCVSSHTHLCHRSLHTLVHGRLALRVGARRGAKSGGRQHDQRAGQGAHPGAAPGSTGTTCHRSNMRLRSSWLLLSVDVRGAGGSSSTPGEKRTRGAFRSDCATQPHCCPIVSLALPALRQPQRASVSLSSRNSRAWSSGLCSNSRTPLSATATSLIWLL